MLKFFFRCVLRAALLLFLLAASVFAQGTPPPPYDFSIAPPPPPNSLPPPVLEWEPLPPSTSGGGSSPVPLPAALFVAPLPPAPALPLPAPPPVAPFIGGPPNPQFELAKPRFEIWRSGAESPETPTLIKDGWHSTFITSGNPITVRLLFDPSLTGTPLSVTPDKGIIMAPTEDIHIGPTGECLFTVDLEGGQEESQISFYSMQINTVLRLTAATEEFIELMANP